MPSAIFPSSVYRLKAPLGASTIFIVGKVRRKRLQFSRTKLLRAVK
ncbi:MAG: hypothetical protein ACTXOO_05950 [Sodalis sp. (in: enterobacteria)]